MYNQNNYDRDMKNFLKTFCVLLALLLPVADYAQGQIKRPKVKSTSSQKSKNTNEARAKAIELKKVITQSLKKGYVDLGLPSGTLWKTTNESGFSDYETAVNKYGDKLPTKEQWEELKKYCTWEWNGNGYNISGDGGKFIVLPAAGCGSGSSSVNYAGESGFYWSSTPSGSEEAWELGLNSGRVFMYSTNRCYRQSVRLVQDE